MKKAFYGLMLILLSGVLLSTVFAKGPATKTKITFWDENAGPNRTPYYEELIKRFEHKNPNIEVEYVGLPWSNALQKYDVAIAANEVPDCGGVTRVYVATFVAKKALLGLDKYFNKWKDKGKIIASEIAVNRSLVNDRKLYMLPNTTNMSILWLRTDILKSYGLSKPQTWDDFYNIIKVTTNKSKNIYGFSLRGGSKSPTMLADMMYGYSGINRFFTKSGKSTVNASKNLEALKRLVGIYKTYTQESDITNGYKEMVAAFDSGRAVMIEHNLGSYGEHIKALTPDKFCACPFPKTITGKRYLNASHGSGYAVFRGSKHPDVAWKFISYLCSTEAQSYWNQKIGQLPTNSDVFKQDWVKDYPHIIMAGKIAAEGKSVSVMPPAYLPEFASIQKQLVEPGFQEVLLGKKSPKHFLNEWAAALEKAKANYDKNSKK
jgi:multiple sugar transport system substrate-binding protein